METPGTSFQNILYEKKGAVAYVTINRPKVLNALNAETIDQLRQCLVQVQSDGEVRSAIVTGAGEKAFIAGADINEIAGLSSMEAREYSRRGQKVFNLVENLGKPVIACINGFALGGGCELAMACTLRLASENAKLGLPETKLGILPGFGGTQRLPRLVGKGAALQLLLTGEMIGAVEALRIGLVNEVVPAGELLPRAEALAGKIASNAPIAVQRCIEAVNHGLNLTLEEGLFLEASLFSEACGTEDRAEGTTAFLEKRQAKFRGR